jgi:hypothetical protein
VGESILAVIFQRVGQYELGDGIAGPCSGDEEQVVPRQHERHPAALNRFCRT